MSEHKIIGILYRDLSNAQNYSIILKQKSKCNSKGTWVKEALENLDVRCEIHCSTSYEMGVTWFGWVTT